MSKEQEAWWSNDTEVWHKGGIICSCYGEGRGTLAVMTARAKQIADDHNRVGELEQIVAYAKTAYWAWKYAASIPSLDATMKDLGELLGEG